MTCRTLVHELGCKQPKTMKELLDITTWHAFGKEVLGVDFVMSSRKTALGDGRGAPTIAANKGRRRASEAIRGGQSCGPKELQSPLVVMKVITTRTLETPIRSLLLLSSVTLSTRRGTP
jgi:hypothetical protein